MDMSLFQQTNNPILQDKVRQRNRSEMRLKLLINEKSVATQARNKALANLYNSDESKVPEATASLLQNEQLRAMTTSLQKREFTNNSTANSILNNDQKRMLGETPQTANTGSRFKN